MHCLVIGGTRFIGPRVVAALDTAGWQVTVAHRGEHRTPLPPGVRELTDPSFGMPVTQYDSRTTSLEPDIVLLMMAMGAADAEAAMQAFEGHAGRIVAVSSGDVYRAYGRLQSTEPGPIEAMPLSEDSPLRESLFPYRAIAESTDQLEYWYDKLLVERAVMASATLPGTVLRLPKVYGPGSNDNLATVYAYRHHPDWRWTHGYVDNVAHAIAIAVENDAARGRIYNVGEEPTPTVAERLAVLPDRDCELADTESMNMKQDLVYSTARIRKELGFKEVVDELAAMQALAARD